MAISGDELSFGQGLIVGVSRHRGAVAFYRPASAEAHRAAAARNRSIRRVSSAGHRRDLNIDDFERDHGRMSAAGVKSAEPSRHEPCGSVAVFEDLYGTRRDLIQPC